MSRIEILSDIQASSPRASEILDEGRLERLRCYTGQLLESEADVADAAYDRFAPQSDNGLAFDADAMADHISGKRVLVTGGNGCIGTVLSAELLKFDPALVATLGTTAVAPELPQARVRSEYADIRDVRALDAAFATIQPDIVYHLAGQRNIGAAESGLRDTLETNILGTRNVAEIAQRHGVSSVVYASSEKALPPYVADAYSVSKKASEWIFANPDESSNTAFSVARLAHITDNSIIFGLMRQWAKDGTPIRLFETDTSFHVQTALGAAHTLMVAGLEGSVSSARTFAVTELGAPVNLVNLALGVIAVSGSETPIYFAPSIAGYERVSLPPIFGPVQAPKTLPLIGQFESAQAGTVATCNSMTTIPSHAANGKLVSELIVQLRTSQDIDAGQLKSQLSWALLDSTLHTLDKAVLSEALAYYESMPTLGETDADIAEALRRHSHK